MKFGGRNWQRSSKTGTNSPRSGGVAISCLNKDWIWAGLESTADKALDVEIH